MNLKVMTMLMLCSAVFKRGLRKGIPCVHPAKFNGLCGIHREFPVKDETLGAFPVKDETPGKPAQSGKQFEADVYEHIKTLQHAQTAQNAQVNQESSWKGYIGRLFDGTHILEQSYVPGVSGRAGNTEDIICVTVQETSTKSFKLSCKYNNEYISHPRPRSFFKGPNSADFCARFDFYRKKYNLQDNAERLACYIDIADLTCEYLRSTSTPEIARIFAFLYPADIHLIHNKKPCKYFPPIIAVPKNLQCERVIGSGNSKGTSCSVHVTFEFTDQPSIKFRMRLHNAAGNKDNTRRLLDPFKWEITILLV